MGRNRRKHCFSTFSYPVWPSYKSDYVRPYHFATWFLSNLRFWYFAEDVQTNLISMAEWLTLNNKGGEFMNVYGSVRGSVLKKSLDQLRDHHKASSAKSAMMNRSGKHTHLLRHIQCALALLNFRGVKKLHSRLWPKMWLVTNFLVKTPKSFEPRRSVDWANFLLALEKCIFLSIFLKLFTPQLQPSSMGHQKTDDTL